MTYLAGADSIGIANNWPSLCQKSSPAGKVAWARSSIARRMGIDFGALKPADRHVEGVVEMMLDATAHSDLPLTVERLWDWNSLLLQKRGRSWRDDSTGPMQVVSGPIGKERVHFQGPPAVRLIEEMERFLDWFSGNAAMDGVMKAALAHLWFVTIHPFDDGNGRMARAIDGAQTTLRAILGKARFWESIQGFSLNERQRGVLNRLLDGFKGAGF